MDNEILYELGIKAKNGDSLAMLKIIDKKKSLRKLKVYSLQDKLMVQVVMKKLQHKD